MIVLSQVVSFEDIWVNCNHAYGFVKHYPRSYNSFQHKLFPLRTSESIAITHTVSCNFIQEIMDMVLCNFIQEIMIVLASVVSFEDI